MLTQINLEEFRPKRIKCEPMEDHYYGATSSAASSSRASINGDAACSTSQPLDSQTQRLNCVHCDLYFTPSRLVTHEYLHIASPLTHIFVCSVCGIKYDNHVKRNKHERHFHNCERSIYGTWQAAMKLSASLMIHITNVGSNFDQVQADALNVDEPEHIGPCVRSVIVPECKQGDSKDERRNSTRASQQTERYVEQQSSTSRSCFACFQCDFTCHSSRVLKNHEQTHQKEAKPPPSNNRRKKAACPICNLLGDKERIREHQHLHNNSVSSWQCSKCGVYLGSNAALSNHAKSDHQFGVGGAKFESTEATRKQMAKRFVPFGQKNDSQKAESVNKRFKHEPPSPPSKVFSEQQLSQSVREILAPTTASSSTSSTQVQPPALSTTPLKRIKSETLMHHLNERMQHVYYDYEFFKDRFNVLPISCWKNSDAAQVLMLRLETSKWDGKIGLPTPFLKINVPRANAPQSSDAFVLFFGKAQAAKLVIRLTAAFDRDVMQITEIIDNLLKRSASGDATLVIASNEDRPKLKGCTAKNGLLHVL